ncbi:MAG: hypothetical protein JXR64_02975 [Spirochaetales bacterium]|nr:hypothetical protein [Spirochaetales bacterium]
MITTVEGMYRYFLQLINKEQTHTINPATFNFLINTSNIDWVKSKLPMNEFNQVFIDDLQVLLVDGDISEGIDVADDFIFDIPEDYMHGINALFDVEIINSNCYSDGIKYKLSAILMKSDEKTVIKNSYYRQPKDSRLYYRYANNKIRLFTGKYSDTSESVGKKMYLDYYKLPRKIEYVFEGISTNSEFGPLQQQEIVERAVQMFLEKNRDPRYQSFLNEQAQKR